MSDEETTSGLRVSTEKTGWDGAAATKAQSSQQLDEKDWNTEDIETYQPPFDPDQLAELAEGVNGANTTAIKKKARYVAGYGFELTPHPEAKEDEPPGRETVHDFWFGNDSKFGLGPEGAPSGTSTEVLERAWKDYEGIGWYALEVLVDKKGTPVGLSHVPAQTIRVRKDGLGYVQLKGNDKQYFARFGMRYGDDKTLINKKTGKEGATGDAIANELIVQHNPSFISLYYGTPDVIPALDTIEGDQGAKQFNIDFFENDAVPRLAFLVEGGTVSEETRAELRQTLQKKTKGEGNSHRAVILDVEPSQDPVDAQFGDGGKSNVSIDIKPLTVGIEEDASFIEYRKENEHDILQVHEVPPVIANRVEDSNRTDGEEQRREFAEEVIAPKQHSFATRLYETIHKIGLGVEGWTIEFTLKGAQNRQKEADIAKTYADAGQTAMTVNELRVEHLGLPPLQDEEGNELPIGNMLLAEVVAGDGGAAALIDQAALDARDRRREAADKEYSITERVAEETEAD